MSIATTKRQVLETERLSRDMEIMGISFEECQIIQIERPTTIVQEGNKELTILVDHAGNLLSWNISADNAGLKAERNRLINAA